MAELTRINSHDHGSLKVQESGAIQLASNQHLVSLRAIEAARASLCFPVFLTRVADSGERSLSALCSFEQGANLFVVDGQWQALYLPTLIQTYPFFLMQSDSDDRPYDYGADLSSESISEERGTPLFDENGGETAFFSKIKRMLDSDAGHSLQTRDFCRKMDDLKLTGDIELVLQDDRQSAATLRGLSTIDEERLGQLSGDEFLSLREAGYLPVIYALLASLFQLNMLLRRTNELTEAQLTQVTIRRSRA